MFKRFTVMTALLAAFLFLIGSSVMAQDKADGGSSKGGAAGSGGSDAMSSRGVGDPTQRPGSISDRPYVDPAGVRIKDTGMGRSADLVYNPAGSRTKDPFVTERPFDPAGTRTNIPSDRELTGISKRLNTTPADLSRSFEKASKANPSLSFGEFLSATAVGNNMSSRYPHVTTANILGGFEKTKSLAEILKSLGVPVDEAKSVQKLVNQQLAWTRLTR